MKARYKRLLNYDYRVKYNIDKENCTIQYNGFSEAYEYANHLKIIELEILEEPSLFISPNSIQKEINYFTENKYSIENIKSRWVNEDEYNAFLEKLGLVPGQIIWGVNVYEFYKVHFEFFHRLKSKLERLNYDQYSYERLSLDLNQSESILFARMLMSTNTIKNDKGDVLKFTEKHLKLRGTAEGRINNLESLRTKFYVPKEDEIDRFKEILEKWKLFLDNLEDSIN